MNDETTTSTGDTATYCPEDDKLRLYVGRVPRDVYLKLKAQGWQPLHKQRETGGGDFAAVWTPEREDTALEYAGGIIEDEDKGPAERAADRAERFAGYREKREGEATERADAYEAGPRLLGYQSAALAERKARQLDRVADRACNAWDKAEYWQIRTARVIGHALYVAAPGVRMGRIKKIEAEIRRIEKDSIDATGKSQGEGRWINHLRLRLAYENQMLEAQGGRAAFVEMEPGGWIGSHQVQKVNKSPVTGRVVSVQVWGTTTGYTKESGYTREETRPCLLTLNIERLKSDVYRAPTDAERQAFQAEKTAAKEARAVVSTYNPTREDADRLQAQLNAEAAEVDKGRNYPRKPAEVEEVTQAKWAAHWKDGKAIREYRGIKVRVMAYGWQHVESVVVITDKPQKQLPLSVWTVEGEPVQEELAI